MLEHFFLSFKDKESVHKMWLKILLMNLIMISADFMNDLFGPGDYHLIVSLLICYLSEYDMTPIKSHIVIKLSSI